MSNQIQNPKRIYDLKQRTARFGANIILLVKKLKQDNINKPIISQLIRAATSIGANYMEADAAESKKDFRHKIGICKKESKETLHWLHMLSVAHKEINTELRNLYKEAHELTLIFSTIFKK
ncbi:four helix bundle protein [Candidatus Roizmanbacteria bacterium RIFCSPLOWO2_02_FULL_38_10]|uniref:Four helix bundle protein n=1 Tax=Candidatus Roizmanbacteria bacterium RIFCSPLOWO2_02_FULL_38_10 TaxID=1802074 RepID=A0A1F7JKW7_9BACT|nr:MAG: four helix bundle protein [Candidatus Roizmanbacteria bacterium RIFCSPLOWO2_02_FULL_38_10]